jgi:hypothetical protein
MPRTTRLVYDNYDGGSWNVLHQLQAYCRKETKRGESSNYSTDSVMADFDPLLITIITYRLEKSRDEI